MNEQPTDARQREILELAAKLQRLDRSEFYAAIRRLADDRLLSDVRYELGYHQDPTKSTWQVREINRLLTKRRQFREARPQWIGIILATLLALASLVVSLLALLKS